MRKFGLLFLTVVYLSSILAFAQSRIIYNSIPDPLPGNVASEGPEAYAFSELGDAVALTANTGFLQQVRFVMSSWGCQSGAWYSGDCYTESGAKFGQPLTISVYSVDDSGPLPAVGSLLGSVTSTYDIPYRPAASPAQCPSSPGKWYSKKDKTCYNGMAVDLMANFTNQHITVPANGKIIVTVAFNTTHYGFSPIGESAPCYTSPGGCPYDSLNIATDTQNGSFKFIGGPLDPNGIMVNYVLPNSSCTGTITTGVLVDDTAPGCWEGYHPEFEVKANVKSKGAMIKVREP